jgi:hydroxymethylglutaryl-CoA reductase (NADPH)
MNSAAKELAALAYFISLKDRAHSPLRADETAQACSRTPKPRIQESIMAKYEQTENASIPMAWVGPILVTGDAVAGEIHVPLATYETPLWPSTQRGAGVSMRTDGILVTVLDDRMTRSICLEAPDAGAAARFLASVKGRHSELQARVEETSRFAQFIEFHSQVIGNLIYLRLAFETGDAAGHNMATAAAEKIQTWILKEYDNLSYVSISGNYCTDKKVSAVNGILGRGKYCVAEMTIPAGIVKRMLKSTPERIVDLHIKKNLLGTIAAGGLRSANAHFANILLGFYLATGQDAANIIEASQGMVHAEVRNGDLYISATLPNLIVGTVGNGKGLPFVQENLQRLGCLAERKPGENARRLAAACAAATLCGELSLLAAQTNPGELMDAHLKIERS